MVNPMTVLFRQVLSSVATNRYMASGAERCSGTEGGTLGYTPLVPERVTFKFNSALQMQVALVCFPLPLGGG